MRVVLIGCTAGKTTEPSLARDLYTSTLFRKRLRFAEDEAVPFFILSAKHGLVAPDTTLRPYDAVLKPPLVAEWAERVRRGLQREHLRPGDVLEVHAGVHYVDGVQRACRWLARFHPGWPSFELTVVKPLKGLGIGEQLAWYDARHRSAVARVAAETRRRRAA